MVEKDSELAQVLIRLLRDGATVTQLIEAARQHLGEDSPRSEWTRAVRAAFGLSPGGWYLVSYTESFGSGKVPDAKLTWVFMPDILANRPAWDNDPNRPPSWFDGLEKTSSDQLRELAGKSHGLSPECWAAMTDVDRNQVLMIETTRLELGENVQMLAALAEQLQRRLNELEHEQPAGSEAMK